MPNIKSIKNLLIYWNSSFPLDKEYRTKHNILFNSKEHREVCQIDIYTQWLEEKIFEQAIKASLEEKERSEQLAKGILIKEHQVDKKEEEELFNKLRKVNFNNLKVGGRDVK